MSNPATLVQRLCNYCNMGLLAPARSGLLPSAVQNPFRALLNGTSLKMPDEQSRLPFNTPNPVPKDHAWPRLLEFPGRLATTQVSC
jgi:hypothetical protein